MTTIIDPDDPRATAATAAVRDGDVPGLRRLMADHPELAGAAIGTGADVNAWFIGNPQRNPAALSRLHRRASPGRSDLHWVAPLDSLTPLGAARRSQADDLAGWLVAQGAVSAPELTGSTD